MRVCTILRSCRHHLSHGSRDRLDEKTISEQVGLGEKPPLGGNFSGEKYIPSLV